MPWALCQDHPHLRCLPRSTVVAHCGFQTLQFLPVILPQVRLKLPGTCPHADAWLRHHQVFRLDLGKAKIWEFVPKEISCAGLEVEIGPILDWSVTIEDEAQVCVQTARAWYCVSSAAQEYEPLFLLPLLFARLCKAVIRSIQEMPSVELAGLLVLVCKHLLQTQAKESLLFHIKVCFHARACI